MVRDTWNAVVRDLCIQTMQLGGTYMYAYIVVGRLMFRALQSGFHVHVLCYETQRRETGDYGVKEFKD